MMSNQFVSEIKRLLRKHMIIIPEVVQYADISIS